MIPTGAIGGWYVEQMPPDHPHHPGSGRIYDGNDFHVATIDDRDQDDEIGEPGYRGVDLAELIVAVMNVFAKDAGADTTGGSNG